MRRTKVLSIFGTRPEAIKMCPLVKRLEEQEFIDSVVCLTGQHQEMLKQVIQVFKINVAYNLEIMRKQQTLGTITTDILLKIEPVLQKEQPDLVLVHGDTTTSFAAALAAFYQKVPVGHIEAGLRTYNAYSPYPEEINRSLISKLAELHFAPTSLNAENLRKEHITKNVYITGNTVLDALKETVKKEYIFKSWRLGQIEFDKKRCILLTAHRRENLGKPLVSICRAVRRIAQRFKDVVIIFPVHMNPAVRETVYQELTGIENILLIEPLDVEDMHNIIARSYLVMTDSGGLQEEAPAFGIPVLVLRTETERPEAVKTGTAKVVGVEQEDIYENVCCLLTKNDIYREMSKAVNPFGDGNTSERIVNHILEWQKLHSL